MGQSTKSPKIDVRKNQFGIITGDISKNGAKPA